MHEHSATRTVLEETFANARARLVGELSVTGHWEGRLSSSALATAIALFALDRIDRVAYRGQVAPGLLWLAEHANADGGWGDTEQSGSNLSTTLLCRAALTVAEPCAREPVTLACRAAAQRADAWIAARCGALSPAHVVKAVLADYGNDRTFSAPILTLYALAGRLGSGAQAWRLVPQLPFELALLPHRLFRWLKLDVVSYALPALIAIGLVRHRLCPCSDRLREALRDRGTARVLKILAGLQPSSGGFLEAIPLTGFVAMSLAACGQGKLEVTRKAGAFLMSAMRPDGSWPIDINLATWVTTLSVNALGAERLPRRARHNLCTWLLAQQVKKEHPFTHAMPGGWAWTDLSGGVPDADDTAGVLLALRRLAPEMNEALRQAGHAGISWLADLQNRDGGLPTFCRGWGRLPFDRSCPDITAHALLALDAWYDDLDRGLRGRIDTVMQRAVQYLAQAQRDDGAWIPLWFGNEHAEEHANPTYGTAQVVHALRDIAPGRLPDRDLLVEQGADWLLEAQGAHGGWGGAADVAPTIEETALAVQALSGLDQDCDAAAARGAAWLAEATGRGTRFPAAPIGLYFASLWYSERLYPLIFTVAALRRFLAHGGTAGRS